MSSRQLRPVALLIVLTTGCVYDAFDPSENEYKADAALERFSLCNHEKLPPSISDAWVYDGGSFNGMSYYVSFRCDTIDDCWGALSAFGAPPKASFKKGTDTKFAVNKYGPNFYWPMFQNPKWNIAAVTDGAFYESAHGNRDMDFWAIDFDDLRVYFHHESGGFPDDPPSRRHR